MRARPLSLAHRSSRRTGILAAAGAVLTLKQFIPLLWCCDAISPRLEPALLATVALELSPVLVLRGRALWLWLLSLDLALTLLVEADLVYFRITTNLLSVQQLPLALHVRQLVPAVVTGLRSWDLLLLIDLPLILVITRRWGQSLAFARRWAWITALGALLLFTAVVATDPYWDRAAWRNPLGAGRVGLVGFHVLNGGRGLLGRLAAGLDPSGERREVRTWFHERRSPSCPPLLPRPAPFKNVVVVQVESLQAAVRGISIGGRSVTPNLDRLAAQGVLFDHAYAQVASGNTSDAEWLSLCSLYPAESGVSFRMYDGRHLRCLPQLLREKRFATVAFHGNAEDVYARRWVYPALGFQRLLLAQDLGPGEQRGLGLSDEALFDKVLARLPRDRPFLAEVITLSSHRPFSDVPQVLALGPLQGTTVGAYLQSIAYADAALGRFVEGLRAAGLLDSTLLVILGDHVGVNHRDTGVELLPGVDLRSPVGLFDFDRGVPLILLGQGLGPAIIHDPVGELDIAPTVAGLMGLEPSKLPFLGRDLLATLPRPVVFPGGSVIDAERRLLVGRGTSTLCARADGTPLPLEQCADLEAISARERSMSQRVLDLDLLSALLP